MERSIQRTTKYTIRLAKQLSYYDNSTLLEFYQPVIGPIACSLYLTLLHDVKTNLHIEVHNPHSRIFTTTQLSKNDFIRELKILESLSLIKTYIKKKNKEIVFSYEIYPPLSNKELINNNAFMELLSIKLDKSDINYLMSKWNPKINELGIDVSEKFNNFNLNISNIDNLQTTEFDIEFNESLLQGFLDQYNILFSKLKEDSRKYIKVLFAVYNIEYYKFASLINKCLSEGKINDDKLKLLVKKEYESSLETDELNLVYKKNIKKVVEDNTKFSKKIKLMSSTTPNRYLEKKLDRKPESEELNLLETIMKTYNVDSTTINILVDFSFLKNNKLVIQYIEKIAKTLKDKGYSNPVDIVTYLIEADNISKLKKIGKIINSKNKTKKTVQEVSNDISITDEELETIWEEFVD